MRRVYEDNQVYQVKNIPARHPLLPHTWTELECLEIDDLLTKTKFGDQLCSIGALIETKPGFEHDLIKPVVVRCVTHSLDAQNIDYFQACETESFLTPCMRYKDELFNDFFVAYYRMDRNGYEIEMTFDWYIKKHKYRMDSINVGSIEPIFILGLNKKWIFSETFKKFLRDIIRDVNSMHGMRCTHGDLAANNIIILSGRSPYTCKPDSKVKLVNCLHKHNLEKEEERKLFEARKKKDWEAILKLILDATNSIESCFECEVEPTHFLNKLKILLNEKKDLITCSSFDHPAIWPRSHKRDVIRKINIKNVAKRMKELGFLEEVCDWRKLVHEDILDHYKGRAQWLGLYRDDYKGELGFNDLILDLVYFIKESYFADLDRSDSFALERISRKLEKCTGYRDMDLYLQSLFPDFFIKLHQMEEN